MKEITVKEGFEKTQQGVLLIDVRETDEVKTIAYDAPYVINIPLSEIVNQYQNEIPRHQEVIIACKAGGRSAKAVEFLSQQGFDKVINLQGGITAWTAHGFPVKTNSDNNN